MRLFLMVAAVGVLVLAVLVLVSCESADNAAARRASAEAGLEVARAEAYARRVAADESRRENGHQRALEVLPVVVLILGGLALAGFGAFIVWDLRSRQAAQPGATDPALLLYLERQRLEQAQLWRAIAELDRRSLPVLAERTGPAGASKEVIVYDRRQ